MRRFVLLAGLLGLVGALLFAWPTGDPPAEAPVDECGFGCPATVVFRDGAAAAPAGPLDDAIRGGEVTVLTTEHDLTDGLKADLTTRTLTQYATDPSTGRVVLVPDLATDLGFPSDNLKSWTFTLREGVRWQDGSPITVEEVALGADEAVPSAGVTVDGRTITIAYDEPLVDLDFRLADLETAPRRDGSALASGPYRVSTRDAGRVILERNPAWDPDTDPVRHQYVERWKVRLGVSQDAIDRQMVDLERSEYAVAASLGTMGMYRLAAEERFRTRLLESTTPCTTYLVVVGGPEDVRVRQALGFGYDYVGEQRAAGRAPRVGWTSANSVMPPGTAGKHDYFVAGEQFSYLPQRARALLGEVGFDAGELSVAVVLDPAVGRAGEREAVLARGFEGAGLAYDDSGAAEVTLRERTTCAAWPTGAAIVPEVIGRFAKDAVTKIERLPIEEQVDAWGQLDEEVGTALLPVIPTYFHQTFAAIGLRVTDPGIDYVTGEPDYARVALRAPR